MLLQTRAFIHKFYLKKFGSIKEVMNASWAKPVLVFAVGLIVGIGGMYLAGVRPQSNLAVCEGIPDVVGLSGRGLVTLNNNKALQSARLVVTLTGTIQSIDGNKITITQGASAPVVVEVGDQTSITGEPSQAGEVAVFKLGDLQQYESIQVYGHLEGDSVAADNVIRFAAAIPQ